MAAAERRRRRKEERPGEILEAAFEEFARSGFAATKLDDVAARAGITKGTIYLYFPSKEDLFLATVREMNRPSQENLAALTAAPQGSAMAILRSHFAFVYAHMVEDRRAREILRMLMAEVSRFPDLADRWRAEVIGPAVEALRRVVRYGIARGEFRASAAEEFPHLLFAPVIMACTWRLMFGDDHALDGAAYLEGHLDLMARGLACLPEEARSAGE
ncbi:TetR/AcrR family transcriptional regulator [Methylobacterium nonmethylotrophicum]|uniref:TetR/AcrR family transcriptional regulator n=1 Tax=Methylobacterium nonmethylotrophicum TaxID=1141884 RepID=A0A4Z0NYC4_9HYPH|nr:TetR/AcrR family transcriptional regulator [Methylobacterium nonmethylotrophicum]TGE01736.1 TetR/AcrR family transcriptional regulator [Methylobacterium nonmethylotrophicum]